MRTLVCTLLILLFAAFSWSQVSFEPEMLVLENEAERRTTAGVLVKNESDKAKEFRMEIEYRRSGPCQLKIGEWASLEPKRLRLKKGESKKVRLELQGMDKRVCGECVLSLFAGERKESRIPLNIRMGMPVFVRINRETRVNGKIAGIEQSFLKDGFFKLAVQVKNTGTLHLTPYGVAWVEDSAGKRLWQVELRPDKPVFPGQTHELVWQGQGPAAGGKGRKLGVRLFWGTLYGVEKLGKPQSAELKVPFTAY